ncbi:MAG: hypothetical protein IT337_01560 [Thermomicrobiales bacterium]|nr:hypothetical protein [Thermomicrobiales bacterium]
MGGLSRAGKHWSAAEELTVIALVDRLTVAELARRLGRTEKAVTRWRERHGVYPTTAGWLTSGWAARESGYSAQRLTALARAGKTSARRVPGGRWWLFDGDDLPRRG